MLLLNRDHRPPNHILPIKISPRPNSQCHYNNLQTRNSIKHPQNTNPFRLTTCIFLSPRPQRISASTTDSAWLCLCLRFHHAHPAGPHPERSKAKLCVFISGWWVGRYGLVDDGVGDGNRQEIFSGQPYNNIHFPALVVVSDNFASSIWSFTPPPPVLSPRSCSTIHRPDPIHLPLPPIFRRLNFIIIYPHVDIN